MSNTTPLQLEDGWPIASPEEAHLTSPSLADLTRLTDAGEYPNTHAVLIGHAGHLVYERYLEGEDERYDEVATSNRTFDIDSLHDLRSISKSVTSLLLGLALDGHYSQALATPVAEYFKDSDFSFTTGTDAITLRHVLTMTAGFDWDEWTLPYDNPLNDEHRLNVAENPIALVFGHPMKSRPGAVWTYNGGLTELLAAIVEQTTGKPLAVFAKEALFDPLGITRFEWHGPSDWQPQGRSSAAAGLRMRARDLAKIGSLVLHNGVWNNQQIVPSEWIQLSGQRHVTRMPWGDNGVYGYGFQWWSGQSRSYPTYRIIAGFGNGGQRLLVVPERHLVVTVFAGNYDSEHQDNGNRMLGIIAGAHRDHT